MEVDKREWDGLGLERGLFRGCLVNLLRALDGEQNAPKLEQAVAAARQALVTHP